MRKSTLLWLFLATVCAAFLFHTSQKVTDGRAQISGLAYDIGREEESLRVLEAEWGYLNQPERLEKLTQQYLHLEPMKGRQFTKISALENRPAPLQAEKEDIRQKQASETPDPRNNTPVAAADRTAGLRQTEAETVKQKPVIRIQKLLSSQPLAATTLPRPEGPAKSETGSVRAAQTAPSDARSFKDVMRNLGVR